MAVAMVDQRQKLHQAENLSFLLLFHLLCLHHCHASFSHDVPIWRMQRSNQFGVEADERTAWKPVTMGGGCVFDR
jgi:hypothetical protein